MALNTDSNSPGSTRRVTEETSRVASGVSRLSSFRVCVPISNAAVTLSARRSLAGSRGSWRLSASLSCAARTVAVTFKMPTPCGTVTAQVTSAVPPAGTDTLCAVFSMPNFAAAF